jgi:hypothetical protein
VNIACCAGQRPWRSKQGEYEQALPFGAEGIFAETVLGETLVRLLTQIWAFSVLGSKAQPRIK